MRAITIRSIKTKTHPETKRLFWFFFAATRGGESRIRIISHLRIMPTNTHQLAKEMKLDYKAVQHHLKILEQNNLVTRVGSNYGATYFPSVLFEDGEAVFDEIVSKLNQVSEKK
ncbi:MAG: winged helix-turn-helix transcriptional regulator [Thaumarchaeota archaeon]|nr:winged helix-turn-helix transcriptional regulator [Nitrososphaerota archaeon]